MGGTSMREGAMARILVVDDQDDIREVVSEMLVLEGHEVRAVPNGRMGLEACSAESFDVVITDIIMPGSPGLDMILELRSRHPDVRIVAMSGGGQAGPDGFLRTAERLGATATIAKPFTCDQLVQAVQTALAGG
jgi:DNA-binding NtrC family response regulator